MPQTLDDFLRLRAALQSCARVELAFMDLCGGDPGAAMLLSCALDVAQAVPPAPRPGKPAAWPLPHRVVWQRTHMSRHRINHALTALEELGYLKRLVLQDRVKGTTCLHVELHAARLLNDWADILAGKLPEAQNEQVA